MKPLITMDQASAYHSPWPLSRRFRFALWTIVCAGLFRTTPKPFTRWRILLLRLFGATVRGRPFVASSAKIRFPWNLTLEDRACIGPDANVYNLAPVTLQARCTIAQEVYLCAGTHDFSKASLPLSVGEIVVGEDAFVGVRALILPCVEIGAGAIVGAGAVVTKDVPPWTIVAGNPARPIRQRTLNSDTNAT